MLSKFLKKLKMVYENRYFYEIYNRFTLSLSNMFILPIASFFVFDFTTINILISIYLLAIHNVLRFGTISKTNMGTVLEIKNNLRSVMTNYLNVFSVNAMAFIILYITNKIFFLLFILSIIVFSYFTNWYEDNIIYSFFRFNTYKVDLGDKSIILFSKKEIKDDIEVINCIKMCEGIFFVIDEDEDENEIEIID